MNKEFAISFLQKNQPMPDDKSLSQEAIDTYCEVLSYIKENPDNDFIALILNSFGEWDGFGVYQTVEDIIMEFDQKKVINVLKESLQSGYDSVRYWCAQISGLFTNDELIIPLSKIVKDENSDIRISAYISLSNYYNNEHVKSLLSERLDNEDDLDAKEILIQILSDF